SVSDIALRREPRLSCNGSLLVAMVIARWWTGSRQHPHAAEGSQSTNRNEPTPGSVRAGGAARNGPLGTAPQMGTHIGVPVLGC
ncbi:TPA: hypothetical protein ACG4LG_001542, partial [Stenotrophomonas maltophilia]